MGTLPYTLFAEKTTSVIAFIVSFEFNSNAESVMPVIPSSSIHKVVQPDTNGVTLSFHVIFDKIVLHAEICYRIALAYT